MSRWRTGDRVRHVAIIGSGVIGSGWAAAFLASGRAVSVFDPDPAAGARVRDHVDRCWPEMEKLGLVAPEADRRALHVHEQLEAALAGADFVQENTPERAPEKIALFSTLDALAGDDVIVASSTSSLSISELAGACANRARFVLGHPFNPVHLMPLVETGGGVDTDPEAINGAQSLYLEMGKAPVRLRHEVFGHIANRLTSAMFREAVSLVVQDICSVEDIDRALRFGPALKWAIQGQFTTFHTSGGAGGLADFLPKFAPGIVERWSTMTTPDLADPAVQAKLVSQMNEAVAGRSTSEIAKAQNATLVMLLELLRQSREVA